MTSLAEVRLWGRRVGAVALPDRFGHDLIDAWLASHGRSAGSLDAVERLSYAGARGMGAVQGWQTPRLSSGWPKPKETSAQVGA